MFRAATITIAVFAIIAMVRWSVLACDDNCKEIQAWLDLGPDPDICVVYADGGELNDVTCLSSNRPWVKNGTNVSCIVDPNQDDLDIYHCTANLCVDQCPDPAFANKNREHTPPDSVTGEGCEDTGNDQDNKVCFSQS